MTIDYAPNTDCGFSGTATVTFDALDRSDASFSTPVTTAITITQAAGHGAHTITPTVWVRACSRNVVIVGAAHGGTIFLTTFALGGRGVRVGKRM